MLEVVDVHSGYGRTDVVHDVSFSVPDAAVFAVMGHNGAGKTTLLKTIMGLIPTRSGSVTFAGEDVTSLRTNQRVARGMAYVPQGQLSFPQLTTAENLQLVADSRRGGAAKVGEMYAMFPALRQFADRKAGLLSGGQRQQLSIARALITEPKLIILDEPTEGIQPNIVAEIEELIMGFPALGLSVLLVEQHISFALTAAAGYAVLASGYLTDTGEGGAEAVGSVMSAMTI
jgi:urea transport system ATP-binding protein